MPWSVFREDVEAGSVSLMVQLLSLPLIIALQLACAAEPDSHSLEHFHFVDLTHQLNESIPTWPGTIPFSKERYVDYDQGYTKMQYTMGEGVGTHIDAPAHFLEGTRAIHELTLSELIGPAAVIDVVDVVKRDPDYELQVEDVVLWEAQFGPLPQGAVVIMRTGWSDRWQDVAAYRNMDDVGVMHFPGFSPEVARFLVEEREIAGVGVDTFSLDPGQSSAFPVHGLLLAHDKFLLENLANLFLLPLQGAWVLALPLKVTDGPEAGARVIAAIPK